MLDGFVRKSKPRNPPVRTNPENIRQINQNIDLIRPPILTSKPSKKSKKNSKVLMHTVLIFLLVIVLAAILFFIYKEVTKKDKPATNSNSTSNNEAKAETKSSLETIRQKYSTELVPKSDANSAFTTYHTVDEKYIQTGYADDGLLLVLGDSTRKDLKSTTGCTEDVDAYSNIYLDIVKTMKGDGLAATEFVDNGDFSPNCDKFTFLTDSSKACSVRYFSDKYPEAKEGVNQGAIMIMVGCLGDTKVSDLLNIGRRAAIIVSETDPDYRGLLPQLFYSKKSASTSDVDIAVGKNLYTGNNTYYFTEQNKWQKVIKAENGQFTTCNDITKDAAIKKYFEGETCIDNKLNPSKV